MRHLFSGPEFVRKQLFADVFCAHTMPTTRTKTLDDYSIPHARVSIHQGTLRPTYVVSPVLNEWMLMSLAESLHAVRSGRVAISGAKRLLKDLLQRKEISEMTDAVCAHNRVTNGLGIVQYIIDDRGKRFLKRDIRLAKLA